MRPLLVLAATLLLGGVITAGYRLVWMPGWTEGELALVRSLSPAALPPLPTDPSNRVADDPRAVELGRAIFFDVRFIGNGEVACATGHLPDRQFRDGVALGRGMGETARLTMPIAGMAHSPFLFWDGRKDSLWAQALGPLESPVEHGGDRTQYTHLLAQHYTAEYESLFGPLPDLDSLPSRAGPVPDPAASGDWRAMPEASRDAVNTVFANMSKALAAYERTISPPPTRFDAWFASGDFPEPGLLSGDGIAGLRLFIGKGECVNCHNGPLFTDNHFHNTGAPASPGLPQNTGRTEGARLVRGDPSTAEAPTATPHPRTASSCASWPNRVMTPCVPSRHRPSGA